MILCIILLEFAVNCSTSELLLERNTLPDILFMPFVKNSHLILIEHK